jgi:hypothetical protein
MFTAECGAHFVTSACGWRMPQRRSGGGFRGSHRDHFRRDGTLCNGAPAANAADAEDSLAVSLTEFAIAMPTEQTAGTITFQVRNNGTSKHNFEIERQGIEQELPQNLAPSQSGTLSPDWRPAPMRSFALPAWSMR